jgi:hypothetical protein
MPALDSTSAAKVAVMVEISLNVVVVVVVVDGLVLELRITKSSMFTTKCFVVKVVIVVKININFTFFCV